MPTPGTPLTEREKCAIFAYKYGILPDIKTAFVCAHEQPENIVSSQSGINVSVSRWAKSDKFQQYADYCTRLIQDNERKAIERGKDEERHEQARRERGTGESERPESGKSAKTNKIDYNDPQQRKALYNRIIAEAADDPKTQLDAAKLIEQTQREDKQAARDNKIQRFYSPLTCSICPLMEKARKKTVK